MRKYSQNRSDMGLISKIRKEVIQFNSKKIIIWFKNRQRTWIGILPKKIYKQPIDKWKDAHITNHQRNGNQNHDITSDLLEWLLSKRERTNVRKDIEIREPLYICGIVKMVEPL